MIHARHILEAQLPLPRPKRFRIKDPQSPHRQTTFHLRIEPSTVVAELEGDNGMAMSLDVQGLETLIDELTRVRQDLKQWERQNR